MAYGEGRELLIQSAVKVAAERGLRGLTFRAVAERAGVNNSLVAHHFGTRDSLLAAALEWAVEQSIETTGLFSVDSQESFADTLLEELTVNSEIQSFQYEMILEARRNPMFAEPVKRLYNRYQEVIALSLERFGIDTHDQSKVRFIFAALDGLVLQYMAGVDTETIRKAILSLWHALPSPSEPRGRAQGDQLLVPAADPISTGR
ncbi:TetR family transcriptional regulator [Okibacterium endophyticum]